MPWRCGRSGGAWSLPEPAGELRGARLRASRIRRGRRSVKRRRAHGHEPCARRVSAAFAADHGSDLLLSTTGVPATQVLQTERVPLSPAATIAEPADADALIVSRAPAACGSCRTRCSRRGSPPLWPSIDRKMPWPRCRQAVPQRRPRVDLVVGEPYRCGTRRAAGSRGRVSGRAGLAVDLDGGRCGRGFLRVGGAATGGRSRLSAGGRGGAAARLRAASP